VTVDNAVLKFDWDWTDWAAALTVVAPCIFFTADSSWAAERLSKVFVKVVLVPLVLIVSNLDAVFVSFDEVTVWL